VSVLFRGLGRPQGITLDREEILMVAASYGGRRGHCSNWSKVKLRGSQR